jgi:hypothetical protein
MNERKTRLIARVSKDFTCHKRVVRKEKKKKKKASINSTRSSESITDMKYIEFIGSEMRAPLAS